jgi:hypothetical protein
VAAPLDGSRRWLQKTDRAAGCFFVAVVTESDYETYPQKMGPKSRRPFPKAHEKMKQQMQLEHGWLSTRAFLPPHPHIFLISRSISV